MLCQRVEEGVVNKYCCPYIHQEFCERHRSMAWDAVLQDWFHWLSLVIIVQVMNRGWPETQERFCVMFFRIRIWIEDAFRNLVYWWVRAQDGSKTDSVWIVAVEITTKKQQHQFSGKYHNIWLNEYNATYLSVPCWWTWVVSRFYKECWCEH